MLTVAVTGLNATDNPGPGISVIRSLRRHPDFSGRVVGLAYDTLDPGIYASDLVDDVFLIPYPSQGADALLTRLRYVHDRVGGVDVILPTLDSEIAAFIALEPALRRLGIGTFLPTRAQLDARSKVNLAALGARAGITVPPSRVITSCQDLYEVHRDVPFPLLVKGVYYGATLARSVDEAVRAFHEVVARWGYPVIVQAFVAGDELDVVALGDGEGGLVGALPMRKTTITDKGKGWAGIAIKDTELIALTRRFVAATRWRGPCEVEVIKDRQGGHHLLEVNPRFPAWTYLSAGAGMNLPFAAVQLAAGREVQPMTDYRVGTMFVRISIDQIGTLEQLQAMAQQGEIVSGGTLERQNLKGAA
jgi:carbamoyl-phosphate synthase large subunit